MPFSPLIDAESGKCNTLFPTCTDADRYNDRRTNENDLRKVLKMAMGYDKMPCGKGYTPKKDNTWEVVPICARG